MDVNAQEIEPKKEDATFVVSRNMVRLDYGDLPTTEVGR